MKMMTLNMIWKNQTSCIVMTLMKVNKCFALMLLKDALSFRKKVNLKMIVMNGI